MNVSSEKSISLWMGTTVLKDALTLDKQDKADVAIIGSGIAGMSVAWELARAGKDVVILDRGPIGKGMTSRTTAHLTAQCDDGFDLMIKRRGEELTKAWYQSQVAGIDRIEANIEELGIACDSAVSQAIYSMRPAQTKALSIVSSKRPARSAWRCTARKACHLLARPRRPPFAIPTRPPSIH
jgi:glycine/D-amino acid oxidase-like deaminating enzyme